MNRITYFIVENVYGYIVLRVKLEGTDKVLKEIQASSLMDAHRQKVEYKTGVGIK